MTDLPPKLDIRGVEIYPGFLSPDSQRALVADLRRIVRKAPLVRYKTPRGGQMSVAMTAAGQVGWVSSGQGYEYAAHHPSGDAWPEIPKSLVDLWRAVVPQARAPESCLINFYGEGARMGMHQDRDEADLTQPVVSFSLGNDGLFRIGNLTRGGKTESIWLKSGDVVVMGGAARLIYHGVDRIRFGSSRLLENGGRINITLRVVS
jgi:alkylated DNA repair protein (DNA oxidative demethylase)